MDQTMKGRELPLRTAPNYPDITSWNLQESSFLGLGRDVHGVMIENAPTLRDAVNLARSCFTIWSKSQGAIFTKLLREAHQYHGIDSLNYLIDMLEFNPVLRREGINYRHLANILTRARTLLSSTIRVDPYCAWKIAAICGLKNLVRSLLGPKVSTMTDPYGRGVLFYYALGGHLELIKEFIQENPHCLDNPQTLGNLARAAAIGGHIPVLLYLRDQHGFLLNHVFPALSDNDLPETLLTAAVSGGDVDTVKFLQREEHGIDRNVGMNLALIASDHGQWHLYDDLAKENDPLQNENETLILQDELAHSDEFLNKSIAVIVAQDAARYGQFDRVLSLLMTYNIPPEKIVMDILNGGNPKLFWYALDKKWFSLEDRFENGATVQHILARQGHLELLKAVLRDERALKANHPQDQESDKPKAAYVLDDNNQSLLHYAAAGGQWKVYSYLRSTSYKNKENPQDAFGSTVAHCAAGGGAVWFLKKLYESESGPEIVSLKDNNDGTVLHDAANSGKAEILRMIIDDFKIDPKSRDAYGRTVLHILAEMAKSEMWIWESIKTLLQCYPNENLADVEDNSGMTVRQIFDEWKTQEDISGELFDIEQNESLDLN